MWRSAFWHHKNWSWQAANPIQKTSWVLYDVLICSQTTREHKIDELNRMEYLCCKSQIGIKEGFDCPNVFPIVIKQISLQACSVRSLTAEMRTNSVSCLLDIWQFTYFSRCTWTTHNKMKQETRIHLVATALSLSHTCMFNSLADSGIISEPKSLAVG